MPEKNSAIAELEKDPSWVAAKELANLVGPVPPTLLDALRILWKAHQANPEIENFEMPDDCQRAVHMIEKMPKLKAPLFSAASNLFPEKYAERVKKESLKDLMQVLGPGLFAVILGTVYVHRRFMKLAPADECEKLSKDIILNMELGFAIGSASKPLGVAQGMLLGALRHLAIGTMLILKPEEFAQYRAATGKKFDCELENKTWGCDHAQVAARLISLVGLRKDLSEMAVAIRKIGKSTTTLPETLQIWRSALFFIDQLKGGICPPQERSHAERLQLTDAKDCEALRFRYTKIREHGSSFDWLLRKSGEE